MTTQTTVVPAGKKRRPARRPAATDGSLDDFFDMSSSAGPKPPKKLKKKPTMNSAATLTPSTSDDLSKNPASAGGPVQVDVTSCEPLPVNDEALTSLPEKPKQDGPEYDGTVTPPPACFAAGTDNLVRLQKKIADLRAASSSSTAATGATNGTAPSITTTTSATGQQESSDLAEIKRKMMSAGNASNNDTTGGDQSAVSAVTIQVDHRIWPEVVSSTTSAPATGSVLFKLPRTHTFHEIIRIVSGLRKVEPPNSLVLSRQGLRVFPSSTPASLGFTEDQKEFLESWVSTTAFEGAQNEDQKKRVAQAEAMLSNESGLLSSLGITLNPSSLQAAVPEPIEEENPQESMYHIQIREKDGKVLKIRVPSEAPLSTLLTKLSELKKVPVKSLKLKLDGDAVGGDESLESLGVEDGDTLDLVIGGSAGVSAV